MRGTGNRILLGFLAAIAAVAFLPAEGAEPPPCLTLPGGATVEGVQLTIVPQRLGEDMPVTLSGIIRIADDNGAALISQIGRKDICDATARRLKIGSAGVCALFVGSEFDASDSILARQNAIAFTLHTTYNNGGVHLLSLTDTADQACGLPLMIRIAPARGTTISSASPLPLILQDTMVDFRPMAAGRPLNVAVFLNAEDLPSKKADAFKDTYPAASDPLNMVSDAVLATLFLLTIAFYGTRRLFGPEQAGPLFEEIWPPLRATTILLAAGALLNVARHGVDKQEAALIVGWHVVKRTAAFFHVSPSADEFALLIPPLAGLMLAALVFAALCPPFWLLARRRHEVNADFLTRISAVFLLGSLAAALVVAGGVVLFPVEARFPTGYEIPAIAVSFLVALFILSSLRRMFGLRWPPCIALSLLIALTLFYPSSSVATDTPDPPNAAYNAVAWFTYLAVIGGGFMYSVALLSTALFHRRTATANDGALDRALLVLLVLSIAGLRFGDLLNDAALIVVWMAADSYIFSRVQPANPVTVTDLGHMLVRPSASTLRWTALFGGLTSMGIFWMQYALSADHGSPEFLVLKGARVLLSAFVTGAIGTLLLGHAFNRIPGRSATGKALLLGAVVAATAIASRLDYILGTRAILPWLTAQIDFFAAILVIAVLVFDIPNARRQQENLPLSQLFTGTTLAQAVPIVTGIGAALFSALSPALSGAVGTAFSDMVQTVLGNLQPTG